MRTLLCFVLLLVFNLESIVAQPYYKSYDWEQNPQHSNNDILNESLASAMDKTVTEFFFEEDSNLVEYFLEHKVYYLNSDDSIEDFNKVYLPYSSNSSLVVTKARVITKDDNIIDLDNSKILTATDEETNKTYKYFAFEGVEKGSFIEYIYVVKRYPKYKGKRLNFQATFPMHNVSFDLFAPNNLIFKFKSYNELPGVEKDTTVTKKNRWFFKKQNIEKLERETLASYDANRKHLIYALDENTASNTTNITSYSSVAQNIYNYYYKVEISKKVSSKLDKLLKDIGIKDGDPEETKIKLIETYFKNNIYLAEVQSDKLSDLETILDDKVANEAGIIKLYVSLFKKIDVKFDFIYTCERDYMLFDPKFEANNFLLDVLFYFKKHQKYMSPTDNSSRYGFPPPYLTDTYGLFIKEVSVGSFKSAVGKIKFINPVKGDQTIDKMIIDVVFSEDDYTELSIDLNKEITGYYGLYMHPFMSLLKPEDRDNVIESQAKYIHEDVDIQSKEVLNEDPMLFGEKPIIFNLSFNSSAFVDKAGNKYLLKVGDLIGPQTELYQEKERSLPVDSQFERSYLREIRIAIPKGFSIKNLEEINISNAYINDENEKLMSFDSYYELDDNMLIITADEHYRINKIGTDIYEEYRKVINSAADFNKITLVMEPK